MESLHFYWEMEVGHLPSQTFVCPSLQEKVARGIEENIFCGDTTLKTWHTIMVLHNQLCSYKMIYNTVQFSARCHSVASPTDFYLEPEKITGLIIADWQLSITWDSMEGQGWIKSNCTHFRIRYFNTSKPHIFFNGFLPAFFSVSHLGFNYL